MRLSLFIRLLLLSLLKDGSFTIYVSFMSSHLNFIQMDGISSGNVAVYKSCSVVSVKCVNSFSHAINVPVLIGAPGWVMHNPELWFLHNSSGSDELWSLLICCSSVLFQCLFQTFENKLINKFPINTLIKLLSPKIWFLSIVGLNLSLKLWLPRIWFYTSGVFQSS